jgi:VP4 protein
MSHFDPDLFTIDSGNFGSDRYASSNSVTALQHGHLSITSARLLEDTKRLNRLEHMADELKQTSEANKLLLIKDLSLVQTNMRNVINAENKTDEVIHKLASGLSANLKYENTAITKMGDAILDNQADIDKLIKDDKINSDIEKAQLLFDVIKDKVEIAAHTTKMAAAVAEEVPLFGDNVAGGLRVVADGTQLAVEIADMAKRNGLIKHIATAVANIKHKHFDPVESMTLAMHTAESVNDLLAKMEESKHTDVKKLDLVFSSMTLPNVVVNSKYYKPKKVIENVSIFVFEIHCINSPYVLLVSINNTDCTYELRLKTASGPIHHSKGEVSIPFSSYVEEFPCIGRFETIFAFAKIMADKSARSFIQSVMLSVFEDICISGVIASDYRDEVTRYTATDKILDHNTHLDEVKREHDIKHIALDADTVNNPLRPIMAKPAFRTFGLQMHQDILSVKGRSLESVNAYPYYERQIGPFSHSGTYRIQIVVDKLPVVEHVDKPWYVQQSDTEGQWLQKSTNGFDSVPLFINVVVANDGSFTVGSLVKKYKLNIRIYGFFSRVALYTGWASTGAVPAAIPNLNAANLRNRVTSYKAFERLIKPTLVDSYLNYHPWSDYTSPNWSVPN